MHNFEHTFYGENVHVPATGIQHLELSKPS